jgi:hypothetical protein
MGVRSGAQEPGMIDPIAARLKPLDVAEVTLLVATILPA